MKRGVNGTDDLSFFILGRRLDVCGVPELHAWLRRYWHFDEHDLTRHPFHMRIESADALPPLADASTLVAGIPGFHLTWQHATDTWQTRTGRTTTRLVLEPGGARMAVATADDDETRAGTSHGSAVARTGMDADAAARAALYTALTEAVRASGLMPVHGAAIARADDATLLLGPSGTGKTTTLLRAVNAGWSPVAEDLVWLDPQSLRVYGWDRGIRLWPGTTNDLVPDVPESDWDVAGDGKLFLPWQRFAQRVPSARLTRIMLLERARSDDAGAQESDVSPLAPQHAVRALWEAAGVPLSAASRLRLGEWIARLVRDVEHVRLRLGGNLTQTLAI